MSNDIEQLAKKMYEIYSKAPYGSDYFEALAAYVIREREKACLEARIDELIKISPPYKGDMTTEEDGNIGISIMYRVEELRSRLTDLKGRKDDG